MFYSTRAGIGKKVPSIWHGLITKWYGHKAWSIQIERLGRVCQKQQKQIHMWQQLLGILLWFLCITPDSLHFLHLNYLTILFEFLSPTRLFCLLSCSTLYPNLFSVFTMPKMKQYHCHWELAKTCHQFTSHETSCKL